MKQNLLYKHCCDISNENLKDPEFKAILDKYNLKPRDYEDGFTRKKEKIEE